MKRRDFMTLIGGAAVAWPLAARAQQKERVRRIGILMPFPNSDIAFQARVRVFRQELARLGWSEGANVPDRIGSVASDPDQTALERLTSRISSTGQSGALVPEHCATVVANRRSRFFRSSSLARISSR